MSSSNHRGNSPRYRFERGPEINETPEQKTRRLMNTMPDGGSSRSEEDARIPKTGEQPKN